MPTHLEYEKEADDIDEYLEKEKIKQQTIRKVIEIIDNHSSKGYSPSAFRKKLKLR